VYLYQQSFKLKFMKTKKSLMMLLFATMVLVSCTGRETEPEDTTKFSEKSIVGTWVTVNEDGTVGYYYDIKSDSHVHYVERANGNAYYKEDGYMYTSQDIEWKIAGDLKYIFDESAQIIRCTSGILWGFTVESFADFLGSDEAFRVERKGLDEAYLYDLSGWMKDAHVYRIKGTKTIK
jgi:hypothetical protein